MGVEDPSGRVLFYQWRGFPDPYLRAQFLTYLEWVDPAKVMMQKGPPGQTTSNLRDDTKTLAQLSLGCAMTLARCISDEPVLDSSPPLLPV